MAGWIFAGVAILVLLGIVSSILSRKKLKEDEIFDLMDFAYRRYILGYGLAIASKDIELEDLWTAEKNNVEFLEFFGYQILWKNDKKRMIAWRNENGYFVGTCSLEYSEDILISLYSEMVKLEKSYNTLVQGFWTIPFISNDEAMKLMQESVIKTKTFINYLNLEKSIEIMKKNREEVLKAREMIKVRG